MAIAPTPPPTPERKKHRSPAYPAINLKQAIERAEQFYEHERRNAASLAAAASHWEYGLKSSGLLTAVAALKSFGLMDEIEGASGTSRTVRLSELCFRIVLDKRPDSTERQAAIKEAALRPKIHAELWRKYNGQLPSDVELKHRLIFDWKFNDNSVDDFIKELRQTISFAKLSESDAISSDKMDKEGNDEEPQYARVGEYVQWESRGVQQFKGPKRVREISDDGGWAFVDGSNTGLPIAELTVVDPPTPPPSSRTSPRPRTMLDAQHLAGELPPIPSGSRQDVFSLAEGPVTIQWPASISPESFEDLAAWIDILKRKIGRSVRSSADSLEGGE